MVEAPFIIGTPARQILSLSAIFLPLSLPAAAPCTSVLTYQAPCRFSSSGGRPAGQAWIGDGRQLVRHPVELVVRLEGGAQRFVMRREIGVGKAKTELRRDLAQLLPCRDLHRVQGHRCSPLLAAIRRCARLVTREGATEDTRRFRRYASDRSAVRCCSCDP